MSRTGDCAQALSILKPVVRKRPHDAGLVLEARPWQRQLPTGSMWSLYPHGSWRLPQDLW